MSSSEDPEELEAEMTNLTVELLSLSQDLITAKLRLEAAAKTGWILLAKARYVRGGGGLDISQVPSTEGDRQMVAGVRVDTKECLQDNKVRYFHHNLLEPGQPLCPPHEADGLKQRGGKAGEQVESEERREQSDPLKWFGILTPPALRQSQASFKTAAELAVETANIQSEMAGVVNRIKFIQRRLKSGPAKQNIEDLDASFSSNLKL